MKIITKENRGTIDLENLDLSVHTVVGKVRAHKVIFHHSLFSLDESRFVILNTPGDSIIKPTGETSKEFIQFMINKGYELHAFEDYKDALRWLIEN